MLPQVINRYAVVIGPRTRFLQWVQATVPIREPATLADLRAEASVYLLTPGHEMDPLELSLKRHYGQIFDRELESWCIDESTWPSDRGWAVFQEWFEYEIGSMVIDLDPKPLRREPL